MPRINTAIRSVWGVSEIGFSIAATLETAFFLFFLTDVAQLPLAISGVIAASASAVDTVSALLAGVFIDKFHFKKEEKPAAPTTKECPLCCSTINIKATKCPFCTGDITK